MQPQPHPDFSGIFDSDVLHRLASRRRGLAASARALEENHGEAKGSRPRSFEPPALVAIRDRHLVVEVSAGGGTYADRQRAWVRYFRAGREAGLLGEKGLLAELRGVDEEAFRGALGECIAAHALMAGLGHEVAARTAGKAGSLPDLRVTDLATGLAVTAEVKSPADDFVGNASWGNSASTIRRAVSKAGAQLPEETPCVAVLVPYLRTPVYLQVAQLVEALIGTWQWKVPIDLDAGVPVGPVEPDFRQKGKLAAIHRDPGTGLERTDLTRVSAVLVIEEVVVASGAETGEIGLVMTVAHNPFAARPIPPDFFGGARQLVGTPESVRWIP